MTKKIDSLKRTLGLKFLSCGFTAYLKEFLHLLPRILSCQKVLQTQGIQVLFYDTHNAIAMVATYFEMNLQVELLSRLQN